MGTSDPVEGGSWESMKWNIQKRECLQAERLWSMVSRVHVMVLIDGYYSKWKSVPSLIIDHETKPNMPLCTLKPTVAINATYSVFISSSPFGLTPGAVLIYFRCFSYSSKLCITFLVNGKCRCFSSSVFRHLRTPVCAISYSLKA